MVEERAGGCQHQRKAGIPAHSQVDSPTFVRHTQHCICIEPKRYYCSVIGLTTNSKTSKAPATTLGQHGRTAAATTEASVPTVSPGAAAAAAEAAISTRASTTELAPRPRRRRRRASPERS